MNLVLLPFLRLGAETVGLKLLQVCFWLHVGKLIREEVSAAAGGHEVPALIHAIVRRGFHGEVIPLSQLTPKSANLPNPSRRDRHSPSTGRAPPRNCATRRGVASAHDVPARWPKDSKN